MFVILPRFIRRTKRLEQPLSIIGEFKNGLSVVVDDPDILLRIVWTLKDAVGTPEHLVPLTPVFDEVAIVIDDIDDVRPLVIHTGLPNILIIAWRLSIGSEERAGRAGRCGVSPRQPSDWELDVRPELGKSDRFRPLEIRQFT